MANIYISTTGAGDNSGSSLANAINGGNQTNLRNAIQGASASDVVRLISGTYTITSTITVPSSVSILGWTAGDTEQTTYTNVIVQGVSGTTYTINSPEAQTVSCFTLAVSTSSQIFKHMTIMLFSKGINGEAGKIKSVTIDDCLIQKCLDCVSVRGDYHTFTTADVNVSPTNSITAASNLLSNGNRVRVNRNTTSAALPGGLVEDTDYYVVSAAAGSFKLSLTSGGSPVTLSSVGTSTCVWYRIATSTVNSSDWSITNSVLRDFARTGWRIWYGNNQMTGTNLEVWGDDGTDYASATLNSGTDTFTSVAHGLALNEAIAFHFVTVPTGWPTDENGNSGQWKIFYVKTVPTADTFTISLTPGGSQITSFTSSGSGITWHRSYSTFAGGQTGIDIGYTSSGRQTEDKNIILTNIFGGECSDKPTNASTGSNWQGDLIKTEDGTTGSINGGYARYCADSGIDCKGNWIVSNFAVNHSLQTYKSYAAAPQKLTLTNCIGLSCLWQGGKQTDPRSLSLLFNGFMDCYNCTFFDVLPGLVKTLYMAKYTNASPMISQITLTDCLWGFFNANSVAGLQKINDGSTTAVPNVLETRTTWYNDRGVSSPGSDPNFIDNTDLDFIGGNTNWNSQLYGSTRGYFYDGGSVPSPPAGLTLISLQGVKVSGVRFI